MKYHEEQNNMNKTNISIYKRRLLLRTFNILQFQNKLHLHLCISEV